MVGIVCLCAATVMATASIGLLFSTFMNRAYAVILLSYASMLLLYAFVPFVLYFGFELSGGAYPATVYDWTNWMWCRPADARGAARDAGRVGLAAAACCPHLGLSAVLVAVERGGPAADVAPRAGDSAPDGAGRPADASAELSGRPCSAECPPPHRRDGCQRPPPARPGRARCPTSPCCGARPADP